MKQLLLILLILLFFPTFSLNSLALNTNDIVISIVNGENIYLSEFDRLLNAQNKKSATLDKEAEKKVQESLIDFLVDRVLVLQEAKERNLQVAEEEITKNLNLVIDKKGGEEAFIAFLKESNATIEDAKREIKSQILYSLVKKEFRSKDDFKSFISKKRENSDIVIYADKMFPDIQIAKNVKQEPQADQESLVPGKPVDLSTLNVFKAGDLTLENVEISGSPQEELKELIKKIQERQLTVK